MQTMFMRTHALVVCLLGLSAGLALADDEPVMLTPVPETPAEVLKPVEEMAETPKAAPAAPAPAQAAPAPAPAAPAPAQAAPAPAAPAPAATTSAASPSSEAEPTDGEAKPRALGASPPPTGRNAIGIALGLSSGMGVSYRRYLNEFVAVRGEGGILAGKDWKVFSLGVGVQEDFLRAYYYRLYALQTFGLHSLGKESLLLVPGIGLGYEHNFSGLRKGWAVRGELVLSPVIEAGNQSGIEANRGLLLLTPLPQIGGSYVF